VRIEGPCYIGADAEVRHAAYLRKGSWICDGAVVGHATEVKNSIFLPGAKAPHFNYVGDSILGFGVNLGAGTKLSNVRNDRREIMVTHKDGSREHTGLRKMGALIGDGSEVGCNVVTNPGAILAPETMVAPNETVSGWRGSPTS
jgi:NDP-sugar pyrophosphorylase family protein